MLATVTTNIMEIPPCDFLKRLHHLQSWQTLFWSPSPWDTERFIAANLPQLPYSAPWTSLSCRSWNEPPHLTSLRHAFWLLLQQNSTLDRYKRTSTTWQALLETHIGTGKRIIPLLAVNPWMQPFSVQQWQHTIPNSPHRVPTLHGISLPGNDLDTHCFILSGNFTIAHCLQLCFVLDVVQPRPVNKNRPGMYGQICSSGVQLENNQVKESRHPHFAVGYCKMWYPINNNIILNWK